MGNGMPTTPQARQPLLNFLSMLKRTVWVVSLVRSACMQNWAIVLGLLFAGHGAARAQVPTPATSACEGRTELVAPCFEVSGRLSYWNGTPSARIWRVGTPRMLGIHHDELPEQLRSRMTGFNDELWADFKVCPFTPLKAGHMQLVCIASWRNLQARRR